MQIVVPMSGFGERFRVAGYRVPKPLFEVEGKPIIAHVVDMFPGETTFFFVCNEDHLRDPEFRMAEILSEICPTGEILPIAAHRLGPVHAVSQIYDRLDPEEPTIVNYCDFTCYWNYLDFKRFVEESACEAAIPCYRHFHPHSLGSTRYAYVRERDGWANDIQEKTPFTETPMEEFASSGTYYFSSARMMKEYFERSVDEGLDVKGEYYVSMAYKPMFNDGRAVAVYEIQHFMQWGTPADFEEYVAWSNVFRNLVAATAPPPEHKGTVLIPMAGLGLRFQREGYDTPKPLIPVSGRPMVVQAASDLPRAPSHVFVMRRDMPGLREVEAGVREAFTEAVFIELAAPTDGQARTCLLGLDGVAAEYPLTIGACDNGVIYDPRRFAALMDDPETDIIIWGMRGYPGALRNPHMYGWIMEDDGVITHVSVKQALDDPAHDPIVIGAFTFKRASDFVAAARRMIDRNARVNGEFYVDTCINDAIDLGLTCRLFETEGYLCWGTPDDLRTFEYWQSCFHKWTSHPYSMALDRRVAPERLRGLEDRFAPLKPKRPGPRP